jgi:hypothetical protein
MAIVLLSGLVSDLVVSKGSRNVLFTRDDKNLLGLGAVGAALIGEGLSSTTFAGASEDATVVMEFFSCTIDKQVVRGDFYKVGFREGQYIDFAIDSYGEKVALAAHDPLRRIVWTLPYRAKGHIAQKYSNIFWSLIISIFTALLLFCADYFSGEENNLLRMKFAVQQAWVAFFMTLILGYLVCKKFYRNLSQATEIFNAFGFLEPAKVNLAKNERKAEKEYSLATGEPVVEYTPWRFRYDQSLLIKR